MHNGETGIVPDAAEDALAEVMASFRAMKAADNRMLTKIKKTPERLGKDLLDASIATPGGQAAGDIQISPEIVTAVAEEAGVSREHVEELFRMAS